MVIEIMVVVIFQMIDVHHNNNIKIDTTANLPITRIIDIVEKLFKVDNF